MATRLRKHYDEVVHPRLMKELSYQNPMQVPRLDKIVLNMGVGETTSDTKKIEAAVADMTAIAGFKVRENMPLGCKVTLRRDHMYEFLDRLVTIALPRVRDFRGLSPKSFDGNGNYALGIKEQLIFPEINYDKVDEVRGMDIIICTTAKSDDEGRALLKCFDFPFIN